MKETAATRLLFLLCVAIWCAAGYRVGEAVGRGWRGAVIEENGLRRTLTQTEAP